MHPPPGCPPRIRSDPSNPFAHHTMAVRVPAILDAVIEKNPDYAPSIHGELSRLADALRSGAVFPALESRGPGADEWRRELSARPGEGWLSSDWFFAEIYAYRQLTEAARFWETRRDPFLPTKREEYAGVAHAEALERALSLEGNVEENLSSLFGLALFGNRIDLSFGASLTRGTAADTDDLLTDDRAGAVLALLRGAGPVHIVGDNAGTELSLDLVLSDFVLERLGVPVVLHVKEHPTFVSDATADDVFSFVGLKGDPCFSPRSTTPRALVERLRTAIRSRRLEVASHPFWNGPASLWQMPDDLERPFRETRLVVSKGDANYRRAVNDAFWSPETPFSGVLSYFPAPLLALRTLKSDTIVGLRPGQADALDRTDPTWRVNGKRGVASLGGAHRA